MQRPPRYFAIGSSIICTRMSDRSVIIPDAIFRFFAGIDVYDGSETHFSSTISNGLPDGLDGRQWCVIVSITRRRQHSGRFPNRTLPIIGPKWRRLRTTPPYIE